MITLSVLVPGIRTKNWLKLYESVESSFSESFEIIFVGPYDLPEELKCKKNVTYIKDFGSPIRSQQIALCYSRGEYISWAADDGFYLPGALDIAYKFLEHKDYRTIVVGKYLEGDTPQGMDDEWYYKLYNHDSMKIPGVPQDCYMLNVGLVHRSLLELLGGWDAATFEVCPMAYSDFAIRAYRQGCKFIFQKEIMFSCTHLPGHMGDHGPIHDAQTQKDEPHFTMLYSSPIFLTREIIKIDNWKNAPEVWQRRFK